MRDRVVSQKIDIVAEENVSCCYALQDKFWVEDPDGHKWEVYNFKGDTETNDVRSDSCCTEDCCS